MAAQLREEVEDRARQREEELKRGEERRLQE